MSRRLGALGAIFSGGAALALALYVFVVDFPRGLAVFACVVVALAAAWYALLRRGLRRLLGTAAAVVLLGLGATLVAGGDNGLALVLVAATFALSIAGARVAFRPERSLPRAPAPRHPVLFVNPWSGDGRAGEVGLVGEAEKRGIETVVLEAGEDLGQLVRDAVTQGADGLAMAGETARRRWSRRSRPSTTCPTPASPREPATTSPSTSASTARTSSARSTPSSTGASVM